MLAAGVALLVPLAARRSRRILTLSEAAKDDIAHYLHVEPDRIDVTPLGPGLADDVTPVPRRSSAGVTSSGTRRSS